MNRGQIIELYACQAQATAARTGRRDYQAAADMLHEMAERLMRQARAAANRQARRRGAQVESQADQDGQTEAGAWQATARTTDRVTLRRRT